MIPLIVKYYVTMVCRHAALFIPILFFVAISIAGGFGQSFGIPNLFVDDGDPFKLGNSTNILVRVFGSAIFDTQVYATAFLGFTWIAMMAMEDHFMRLRTTTPVENRDALFSFVPAVAVLSLVPLFSAEASLYGRVVAKEFDAQILVLPLLGTIMGLAIVCALAALALSLSRSFKIDKILSVLAVTGIAVSCWSFLPITLPAKFLFVLLFWIVVAYLVIYLLPAPSRVPVLVTVVTAAALANNIREKFRFPALEPYYEDRIDLSRLNPYVPKHANADACEPDQQRVDSESGPIDPIDSLQHWWSLKRRELNQTVGTRGIEHKPKLVIIATSGGAYRATFWTALVLEKLLSMDVPAGDLAGFGHSIKLITGASGGMVAGAYFVASRVDPAEPIEQRSEKSIGEMIESDIKDAQDRNDHGFRNPLLGHRDSLSAVVRQLVLSDLPSIILPMHQSHDRGRELESHWQTIARSFTSLRAGEAAGWRPHIVLSPMLVETGQPLLISNLDLSDIVGESEGESVEFFHVFPQARSSFQLGTAVRMSATFPMVSPAVQLPTKQTLRVVDAGYYDNYGVSAAIRFLQQQNVTNWIKRCTSGVMLVQIRAFKTDPANAEPGTGIMDRISAKFTWLTAPLEGALAARYATNLYRNNQEIRIVEHLYGGHFTTVVFEPESEKNVTMTWDLTRAELKQLEDDLNAGPANRVSFARVKQFWADESTSAQSAKEDSVVSKQ
jgi:hypothetical protein